MRLLIDAQLPPRLAIRLCDIGHEAIHVVEIGLADAADAVIWRAALERAAILVTKDRDFTVVRAARGEGPVIIWIRIGNTSNDALIARVVSSLDAIEEAIKRGDTVVEVVAG